MVFSSVEELSAAATSAARIEGDAITPAGAPASELIDRLAHTSALGGSSDRSRRRARYVLLPFTSSTWRWARTRPAGLPCRR